LRRGLEEGWTGGSDLFEDRDVLTCPPDGINGYVQLELSSQEIWELRQWEFSGRVLRLVCRVG
jgi:hypothetical protein